MNRLLAVVLAGIFIGSVGKLQAAGPDIAVLRRGCANTPAAALTAALGGAESTASANGYRVEGVRWDPLLRQNWAMIQSCDHPERPPLTMLTKMLAPHAPARFALVATRSIAVLPIVRAGDVVRLWRLDRFAHIEMIGTAEENGAVGSRVRIRLPASRDLDGQVAPPQYLAGVVRGPADVEMER